MDQIFLSELHSNHTNICKVLGKKIPPTHPKSMKVAEDAHMKNCAFLPLPPDGIFVTSISLKRYMPLLTLTKL